MSTQAHRHREGLLRPTASPKRTSLLTVVAGLILLTVGWALRHNPIDAPVVKALNDAHLGVWGQVADFIYRALEPPGAVATTILITIVVAAVRRSIRIAIVFAGTVALTWLPTAAFKVILDRPRPSMSGFAHPFTPAQLDGSFPSGHTAYIAALAITFWFLLRGTRWSVLAVTLGSLATITTGVAVVSDGLHYPTDASASVLWALAMAPTARWAMATLTGRWFAQRERSLPS